MGRKRPRLWHSFQSFGKASGEPLSRSYLSGEPHGSQGQACLYIPVALSPCLGAAREKTGGQNSKDSPQGSCPLAVLSNTDLGTVVRGFLQMYLKSKSVDFKLWK